MSAFDIGQSSVLKIICRARPGLVSGRSLKPGDS